MAKSTSPVVPAEEFNILDLIRSGQVSFSEAMAEADVVEGSDLFTGDMLSQLEGVPFVILGGTFRAGFTREVKGQKYVGDYVSLEVLMGDDKSFAARGISLDGKAFSPLQIVRFNDGSTGVRRQMVNYLAAKGYIQVSDTPIDEIGTAGGKMGDSEFDIPVSYWKDVTQGELRFNTDGEAIYDFKIPRGLSCPRGLRKSEYRNEFGDGITRYLG